MALRCGIDGCNARVRAWSGLQELEGVMRHCRKRHGLALTMNEALFLRAEMESGGNITVERTAPGVLDIVRVEATK